MSLFILELPKYVISGTIAGELNPITPCRSEVTHVWRATATLGVCVALRRWLNNEDTFREFRHDSSGYDGTFMFGHDRFSAEENYGATYKKLGAALPEQEANKIVQAVFDYLEPLYPDIAYRECFPSLDAALDIVAPEAISGEERRSLITTFAHHELGTISLEYAKALRALGSKFRLGLVADIWAPSEQWLSEFERAGVLDVFEVLSVSSDDGVVKPSGKPFIRVLTAMDADPATYGAAPSLLNLL